jgi:hypothetical protein
MPLIRKDKPESQLHQSMKDCHSWDDEDEPPLVAIDTFVIDRMKQETRYISIAISPSMSKKKKARSKFGDGDDLRS